MGESQEKINCFSVIQTMNEEQLKQWVEQGLSQREIGKLSGKCSGSVNYWLKKFNLKTKNPKIGTPEFQYRYGEIIGESNRTRKPKIDEEEFLLMAQGFYDSGLSWTEVSEVIGCYRNKMMKYIQMGFLITRTPAENAIIRPVTVSTETRLKISEARRVWIKENPDKHPWKKQSKFKSVPCQIMKDFFILNGVFFAEEYIPIKDRGFSIDIAFPNKMFGIEINGNQHYERTGELKEYYQNRHNLITNNGWEILEVHYSLVWNEEFLAQILDKINNKINVIEFDYHGFAKEKLQQKPAKKDKCSCGEDKTIQAKLCKKCNSKLPKLDKRRPNRPTKEELEKLIQSLPMTTVGKNIGVSDNAVRKWCIEYGIDLSKAFLSHKNKNAPSKI